MGSLYTYGINPFYDILMVILITDGKTAKKINKNEIRDSFISILEQILENSDNVKYLDFDIVKRGYKYKIVGNNMISALWISGIFIRNVDIPYVLKNNSCTINDTYYVFDPKKKKLLIKKL